MKSNRAVFVDRDGTIAPDVHYCRSPEDFQLFPNVPEAIRLFNNHGFKVVVVTNQSGIARGYFTEEILDCIHQKMKGYLVASEAHVDAIYYCPHHPDDGCECRKPGTALFHKASQTLEIDFSRSYVIGDSEIDISAGKSLGCKTVLVTTGPLGGKDITAPPDHTANSFEEAARWVIENMKRKCAMKQISVVIPALNEKDGIEKTVRAIPKFELENMGYTVQALVVDNNSNDGTGELARHAGAVVVHELVRGYGSAFKAGFANAAGDIIVTADADGTYPLEDIPRLVKILEDDNLDFVTTNRFGLMIDGAMSFRNKVGNAILSTTMAVLFQINVKDSQSGMWIFKKDLLKELVLTSNTPLSQEIKIEAFHFAKCRWKEVLIKYKPRAGKVKLGGWKVGFGNLLHLFKKRFVR
jgi:histidinol-phosphate phosphatase family protein